MVSICCITYNHETFIAKAIEGFLMQQTSFPFKIIIGEDYSTDRTRDIVQKYARRHPELINLIISDTNVGILVNERRVMLEAKGKYIAFCEGDDYWTDPFKLQKQVDFLETHPEYSVCFHRWRNFYPESNEWKEDNCGQFFPDEAIEGIELTTEMFFSKWITQPLTMVYRNKSFDLDIALQYRYYRDIHQIYHLLLAGKGYLFAFEGGVRNVHSQGIAGMKSLKEQCDSILTISHELYKKNHTADTKKYYEDILQWCIYEYCGRLKSKRKGVLLVLKHFILIKSFRRLGANSKRLIS